MSQMTFFDERIHPEMGGKVGVYRNPEKALTETLGYIEVNFPFIIPFKGMDRSGNRFIYLMRNANLPEAATLLERHKFFDPKKTDLVTYLGKVLNQTVNGSDVDCKKKVKEKETGIGQLHRLPPIEVSKWAKFKMAELCDNNPRSQEPYAQQYYLYYKVQLNGGQTNVNEYFRTQFYKFLKKK